MPPHSFAVGQMLEFDPGKFDGTGGPGAYTVVRLLPNDGSDRGDRGENVRDGHERVVRGSQLRRLASLGWTLSRAGCCLASRWQGAKGRGEPGHGPGNTGERSTPFCGVRCPARE